MLRIEYAEITTCYEFFLRVPCVESLHDQVLQSNVTVRKLVKKKIDSTASNPGDFDSTSNFQRPHRCAI